MVWQSEPVILPSARKHGVADVDMLHALRCAFRIWELDDEFTMFVGPSTHAHLLEVGVIDGPVIVHAMRARPEYLQ